MQKHELGQFPDKSFDFVILSQTLQAFYNPVTVLRHLLRIGKSSIVSIPNFGYWKVRTSYFFLVECLKLNLFLTNGMILQIYTCVL